jgi:hypothetical protein
MNVDPDDRPLGDTRRPTKARRGLYGFVRDVSHIHAGDPRGQAFASAVVADKRVLLQFEDTTSDTRNRALVREWTAEWNAAGVAVDGWWRVEQRPTDDPPPVPGVSRWWPNAEREPELVRLPSIYNSGPIEGLATLGKIPNAHPPTGRPVAIECFRETPASDTNVRNSVGYWEAQGIPARRQVVMLQGYGVPFAPPADEARVALELGVRKLALYPLDGFTPEQILEIGGML